MEAYIVVIDRAAGKRTVKRPSMHLPLAACTGNYERLSDLAIRDIQKDLEHEINRRTEAQQNRDAVQAATGGWSPFEAMR